MAQEEKPFYIRQLPKEAQDWLKNKAYKSFIADGDKEEDAQKKAEDFLDEKVYTAEEMYGKDFLNEIGKTEEPKYEVVNDFSIDAIKDNFTPPGAKGESLEDIDQTYEGKNKEIMKDLEKDGWAMTPFVDRADYFKEQGYDVENKGGVYMIKPKPENSMGAKDEDDYNPQSEVRYTSPEELKLSEMSEEDLKQGLEDIKRGVTDYTDAEEPIVTGWIKDEMAKRKSKPTDEMADFQKSLDDYAAKNKKGRDDIPVATRR